MYSYYDSFGPYVSVAQRRANALAHAAKVAKKEKRALAPVEVAGRQIAASFWGKAWCEHLEKYSDYANRLPRGRTYVRNGSVVDLQIERGKVRAIVAGRDVYKISIDIKTVAAAHWARIKQDCTRSIDSLIDLLQGRFDEGAMQRLTQRDGGLFPQPREVAMRCSCPDWAGLCKHLAAVLYGVGARLDKAPELLFTLRDVDHLELISAAVDAGNLEKSLRGRAEAPLAESDLGDIFGIDLEIGDAANKGSEPAPAATAKTVPAKRPRAAKKTSKVTSKGTKKKRGPAKGAKAKRSLASS